MDVTESRYRRYVPSFLLLVGLVALFLLGVSYVIEIRLIFEEPQYGDVTRTVRAFWRAVLGVTTISSFLIGVYTLLRDEDSSAGLPTKVEIKGTGHDIDVYPSRPIRERADGEDGENERDGEDVDETVTKDDAPSTASDERNESNATGGKPETK